MSTASCRRGLLAEEAQFSRARFIVPAVVMLWEYVDALLVSAVIVRLLSVPFSEQPVVPNDTYVGNPQVDSVFVFVTTL